MPNAPVTSSDHFTESAASAVSTWWTYVVECADGTLYTGIARELTRRLAAHNDGTAAKYTRPRRPVSLRYSESFPTRGEALRREAAIKRLSRTAKLTLIASRPATT